MTASHDRLLELLTDRALVGLGQREQIELAELLVQIQDVDVAAFDRAAAIVALAGVGPIEPMPSDLADKIEARAMAMFDGGMRPTSDYLKTREIDKLSPGFSVTQVDEVTDATPLVDSSDIGISKDFKRTQMMDERPAAASVAPAARMVSAPAPIPSHPIQPGVPSYHPGNQGNPGNFTPPSGPYVPSSRPSNVVAFPGPARERGPSRVVAIGGWLAAAACLLLAVGAFMTRSKPGSGPVAISDKPLAVPTVIVPITQPTPSAAPSQTPAQLREQLLASQNSARADWSATKDPAGKAATGEVVWNKEQQRGTMRFRGLAKNDPKVAQYQLWIFDKTRDDKFPVDGGVFDVDSETGDVIVPIRATLPVATPTLFAVTLEKPGGVVVSKRERIVVTAKLGG
jgi:hypothetical protein